ncbi:outward rectifying potassium channel protein [Carex rostrata]
MADFEGAHKELTNSLLNPGKDTSKKKPSSQLKPSRFRRTRSATSCETPSSSPEPAKWVPGKNLFGGIEPSFKLVALLFLFYLLAASTCFYIVENQMTGKRTNPILDAVYFTIVTMTTVGYGDLVPNSAVSKLLACAFVFLGVAVVALLLNKAADRLVEKQEALLFKALNMKMKGRKAEMLKAIETNKAKYKFYSTAVVLVLLMATGIFFLWKVEQLNFVDSFYCVCSTITTLGYGDKSFSSKWGRVFAVFWIVISTLIVAQFFFYLAEWNTEHKQKKLAKWVLTRRTTNVDLEAADFDGNHIVSAPEFIIYKLKEIGKITEEDIAVFLEEFENLDVDHSGTLSPNDLIVAQSNQR